MPRLYVLSGAELGASFDVEDGAVVGRAPTCTVRLTDASISREHARLERDGRRWRLVDLRSRNGLWQAGERVEEVVLVDLDEVTLGDVQLRFRVDAPAPEAAPVRAPAPPRPAAQPAARGGAGGGLELEDEIDLEALGGAESRPASTALPEPRRQPAADDVTARRAAVLRAGSTKRGSVLTDALEDRPAWLSLLLFLVVLAAAGGLAYGVFRLVVGARGA